MTGKKKFLTLATTLIASVSLGVGVVVANGVKRQQDLFVAKGNEPDPYYTTLNSSNVPTDLTASYQQLVNGTIKTGLNNSYKIQLTRAKTLAGGFCQLAGGGKIYNFGSQGHMFNGLQGMQVTFSGQLKLRTAEFGQNGVGAFLTAERTLTSGTPIQFPATTHFQLEAGDDGAEIQSIVLAYSCENEAKDLVNYNGTYTGYDEDGDKFELVINNGTATISSSALPVDLVGTVSLEGDRATCVFPFEYDPEHHSSTDITYVTDIKDYGRKFEFVSKSDTIGGVAAGEIAAMDFYRVFNVQNFEQYDKTGVGYDQGNKSIYNNTGVRRDYACNYGATGQGNDYIGGTAMGGDLNYLTYNETEGVDGSKTALFKGNSGTCRYYSMNTNLQVAEVIGKGTTFSFWAKTAKSTDAYGGDAKDATIIARVYEGINRSSTYKEREFTVKKDTGWNEYKVNLDASKPIYGYAFFCKTDNAFLPIDNISIYTERPEASQVAESATKITKAYNATINVTVSEETKDVKAKIQLGANGFVQGYCTEDMAFTSYSISDDQITLNSSKPSFGTWVGTLSNDNNTITFTKANIGPVSAIMNQDSIVFNQDPFVLDGSEGTDNLQAALVRQWGSWGTSDWNWTTDTTNTNRFLSDGAKYIQGNKSISVRPYKDGVVRIYINPTVAQARSLSFESIGFWYYVPRNEKFSFTVRTSNSYNPFDGEESTKNTYLLEKEYNTTPTNVAEGWYYLNWGVSSKDGEGNLIRQKNFYIQFGKTPATPYIDYLTLF